MKPKLAIIILICTTIFILIGLYVYHILGNSDRNYYPQIPGLLRLDAKYEYRKNIFLVGWENENSILYLAGETAPGGIFYRYNLVNDTLDRAYVNFKSMNFQISPDKKWIAFTGWRITEKVNNGLWAVKLDGEPQPVAETILSGDENLQLLGWTEDGNSLVVSYRCKPMINCIGLINIETQNVQIIYEMEKGDRAIKSYDWLIHEDLVYVIKYPDQVIISLSLNSKIIEPFTGTYFRIGEKIPSKNWMIGIDAGAFFIVSIDYRCIEKLNMELGEIATFDMIETQSGIKLIYSDRPGNLYLLDLNKALQSTDLQQLFTCNQ